MRDRSDCEVPSFLTQCDVMKISYELRQEDFLEAMIAHRNRKKLVKWARRILIAMGGVLMAAVLLSLLIKPSTEGLIADMPFFLVVGFWIVILWALPRWSARKQFSGQPSVQGPRVLSIEKTGMHWIWNGGSADAEWRNFVRSVESENLILLYTSPACFNILPKRVLTEEELSGLRQMIEQNISIGK
jgi:hypothetical protein